MRRISIDLIQEDLDAICRMAERDRRSPREQAAWLLSRVIAQSNQPSGSTDLAAAAPRYGNGGLDKQASAV
jgi:hypothetical protein